MSANPAQMAGVASANARSRNSTAKRSLIELKQAWENGYVCYFRGGRGKRESLRGGLFGLVKAILDQGEYGGHSLLFIGAVDFYRELAALNCSEHH